MNTQPDLLRRATLRGVALVWTLALAACSGNSVVGFDGGRDARADAAADVAIDVAPDVQCATGQTRCGEVCTNTQSDRAHCGMCGRACAPGEICNASACTPTCPMGQTLCRPDGGTASCATLPTDVRNCGMCGRACAAGESCVSGMCMLACPTGQRPCTAGGGDAGATTAFCADVSRDVRNCGTCGNACPSGRACVDGMCSGPMCPTGQTLCGLDCTNTQFDPMNCGSCGRTCPANQVCMAGSCRTPSCPTGQTMCGATCTNTQFDPSNCGACGRVCLGGQACVSGACAAPSCPSGQVMCASGCTNTQFDPDNCGGCGRACTMAPRACSGGVCVTGSGTCSPPLTMCGATCTNTANDPANCGACGRACAPGEACVSGACMGGGAPPNDTCAGAIDITAGGVFTGTTCGARDDFMTSCGGAMTPDVFYAIYSPRAGSQYQITIDPPDFAVELELPCAVGHNGCGNGSLSISFGGGANWGIGIERRTPGTCGAFRMTVTVR